METAKSQKQKQKQNVFFFKEETSQTLFSSFVISRPRRFWDQTHQTLRSGCWKTRSCGPPSHPLVCKRNWKDSLRNDDGNVWLSLAEKHGNQGFLECRPPLGMAWREFCGQTGRPCSRRCVRIVQCVRWELVESLSSCLWGFPSPSASPFPIRERSRAAEPEFPAHLFHWNAVMSGGQELPALPHGVPRVQRFSRPF